MEFHYLLLLVETVVEQFFAPDPLQYAFVPQDLIHILSDLSPQNASPRHYLLENDYSVQRPHFLAMQAFSLLERDQALLILLKTVGILAPLLTCELQAKRGWSTPHPQEALHAAD
jgi:hypothetical protein